MGRPDVLFNVPLPQGSRLIGWMELKYDPAWPVRDTTLINIGLTEEQFRHLAIWERHTNDPRSAVVLFGVGRDWWLFPHDSIVVLPKSKWSKTEIIQAAWFSGQGYSSLCSVWQQLTQRPRFKES